MLRPRIEKVTKASKAPTALIAPHRTPNLSPFSPTTVLYLSFSRTLLSYYVLFSEGYAGSITVTVLELPHHILNDYKLSLVFAEVACNVHVSNLKISNIYFKIFQVFKPDTCTLSNLKKLEYFKKYSSF